MLDFCGLAFFPAHEMCLSVLNGWVLRCVLSHFSCVQLLATPWTVAHQVPLSMVFSNKNTEVGCHPLLQGIFLTQRLNLGLSHCRQILYHLNHQETSIRYLFIFWPCSMPDLSSSTRD